jgi:hypothetical protein
MKNAFLLALAVACSAVSSFAASAQPVEEVFNRYWAAYVAKDFAKAATEMLPSDLQETKDAVLPVFLAAQSSKDKQAQEILGVFFGRTVGKAREAMTPADVYAGLMRITMTNDPQMFDMLKDAALSIIFVRTPSPDEAEVHFQVTIRGASDQDAEALVKKNGRWWVRMKDNAKDVAAGFKAAFEKKA